MWLYFIDKNIKEVRKNLKNVLYIRPYDIDKKQKNLETIEKKGKTKHGKRICNTDGSCKKRNYHRRVEKCSKKGEKECRRVTPACGRGKGRYLCEQKS